MGHLGIATKLAILAVTGQGLIYLISIILARQLGVDGFEAYVVASSVFTMMVVIAPRGIEKLALRIIPVFYERKDWGSARGFLQFGLRRTLGMSLLVGVSVYLWVQYFSPFPPVIKVAIGVSCLSLPSGAVVHYGIEVLSANERLFLSAVLFRVVVPATVLILIGLLLYLPVEISGAMAVGAWGAAWTLVLAVVVIQVFRSTPSQVFQVKPTQDTSAWRLQARPFQNYRIALAILAQVSVILIDRMHPSAAAVGAYVAAMATVNLALVLATTTNRFYSRRLSILLEQRDFSGVIKLRRERLQWLIPTMSLFLIIVFGFGRDILGLFRPEFIEEGITALHLLAITTVIAVLFSLAPTYLKYMGHNQSLLKTMVVAAAAQILLLVLLVPHFAATGGALAYAISMCGMYLVFARLAHNKLVQLETTSGKP